VTRWPTIERARKCSRAISMARRGTTRSTIARRLGVSCATLRSWIGPSERYGIDTPMRFEIVDKANDS